MNVPETHREPLAVVDDEGLIYSVRARCYVHSGTDEEKLTFLRSFAETDYLIAQPFLVPEGFNIHPLAVIKSKRYQSPHTVQFVRLSLLSLFSRMQFRQWRSSFQRKRNSKWH